MSAMLALFGFAVSLVVTLAAAALFADRLDRIGARIGLGEALLGVLTAVAADGPELAASLTALLRGEHDVGLGVVLGSNIFNLTAMLGVGALVAGSVRPRRESLAIEAVVAIASSAAAGALILGLIDAPAAVALLALVLVPYIALLVVGDQRLHLLPLPARAHTALQTVLGEGFVHHRTSDRHVHVGRSTAAMAAAVAGIVAGSIAMVSTSLTVADHVHLSHALVGVLILAVVTSLPNAATAIRLARQGRGDAVVSEAMNSNTINLAGGLLVPAVIVGLGTIDHAARTSLVWMCAITAASLVALSRPGGLGRGAGAALVLAYVVFVVTRIV